MLSAVKLLKSVSMSGPSAIEKPISAKISVISSVDLAHRMDAAFGERAFAHRQRDVGALVRELARSAQRAPSVSRLRLERLADATLQLLTAWP